MGDCVGSWFAVVWMEVAVATASFESRFSSLCLNNTLVQDTYFNRCGFRITTTDRRKCWPSIGTVYLLYLITLFIPGHLCTINQQLGTVINLYVHGINSLKGISGVSVVSLWCVLFSSPSIMMIPLWKALVFLYTYIITSTSKYPF